MYIKIISILIILFAGYSVNAQSDITGKWKNEETGSIIEIYKQNNLFYGKINQVSGNESKEKVGHLLLNKLIYNSTKKNTAAKLIQPME